MTAPTSDKTGLLSSTSLALGVASAALVFAIGFCALVGVRQGWIGAVSLPLLICGASSAFLGVIGGFLGLVGLLGRQRARAAALAGLLLSLLGICLFVVFLQAVAQGG